MSRMPEHALLEPPSPAYTNVTVRRAFIVWLHCGQTNKFKDVCNYFHYLEGLEERLSVEHRATSRRHEFDLFANPPPFSTYLAAYHPKLYTSTQLENYYVTKLEAIRNEKCVFKLEGFDEIGPKYGATKQEILETSRLIRNYCMSHSVSLRKFLNQFKMYAVRCELKTSVQNVARFVRMVSIKEEITLISNCPRTFNFLGESSKADENTCNSLNSKRRVLDNIKVLTPTIMTNDLAIWCNDRVITRVLKAKDAFMNTPQKYIEQTSEVMMVTDFVNGLKQKYKNEHVVS